MGQIGESFQSYNLLLSEQQLASQYSQSPSTARKLINFIPSRAGDLKRKPYSPPFVTQQINIAGSDYWYSFAREFRFYIAGVPTFQFIIGASNNSATFLYKYDRVITPGTLIPLPAGAFSPPHNESGGGVAQGWIGDPLMLYSDGLLFISDGDFDNTQPLLLKGNWTVYDGVDTWKMGMDRPAPVAINSDSSPGSIQIDLYREYVITEYDAVRNQESIPSTRVRFSPVTPDTFDVTLDLPARVNKPPGTTLSDWTVGYPLFFRIYASHVDGSGTLFRIAEVAAADVPGTFIDTVPFWGESLTTAMQPKRPPFRNQKPRPSLVGAKMANRFALRDEQRRSRIWIGGFEEVREQDQGTTNPLETVPGSQNEGTFAGSVFPSVDALEDQSDFDNFIELPNEDFEVRALKWWEEGLMVGTERSVTFVWGNRPENLRPSNSSTYGFGLFSRNAFLQTKHGLVMFTADRKLVIDPAARQGGSAPLGDRTSYVYDIGWPKQPDLDKTDIRFTNRFQMVHWQFGSERDFIVIAYTTLQDDLAHLLVYTFEIDGGGWITFDDVKATCVGIVQEDEGFQVLVAGNSVVDRQLKVLLDFDSNGTSPYQTAAARYPLPASGTELVPANTWRTSLLDIERPDLWKIWRYLSYFKKGAFSVVVDGYFDPGDIDNLLVGEKVTLAFDSQLSSKELRAWPNQYSKRAVFEFAIAADANNGSLSGVEINVAPKTNIGA